MVGDDHELQPGSSGGGGNFVQGAAAVGCTAVHVHDAAYASIVPRRWEHQTCRRKHNAPNSNGGHKGRRYQYDLLHAGSYSFAADFSAAALSVRSHVKSGSVRPKWPNAAVCL